MTTRKSTAAAAGAAAATGGTGRTNVQPQYTTETAPMQGPPAPELLQAALGYAASGWRVLPLRPRSKAPRTAHGVHDATSDPATITQWWRACPDANIGIATGKASGLLVVDVDPRSNGEEGLHRLEQRYGPLPPTALAKTGGGGWHIFFHCPDGCRSSKLADGLDLKGDGGYVVAAPSVHPNGKRYVWLDPPERVPLASPPAWLLEHTAKKDSKRRVRPIPDRIAEGQRNTSLTRLAGSMRRCGMSEAAILAALKAENAARCDPPLPEEEVRRIAASISRYEPALPGGEGDYGHASVLAALWQNRYRWATHRGRWMRWTGQRWEPADEERVAFEASVVLRKEYASQIDRADDREHVKSLCDRIKAVCTYSRVIGALNFLRGWPAFFTRPEEWDADPWLLNVANGTLDLRTGTLRPHDPADLITKIAPVNYDPDAPDERWRAHIGRFLPSYDVRRQVQRDLGVALVGAVLDETLPIWYGTGANGKTTTARAVLRILGDYADRAAPDLLIQSRNERHPTEIADLAGLRLAFSIEVDQAKHLAEALVKDLTGGDRKKARFMRQDFFSFEQTFSIVLIVNHKPIVSGTDDGLWRRIRLVPWQYRIPDEEKRPQDEVLAELEAEGSAVLNWLLAGLRDWQADRLWCAPEVVAASDAYRKEMDVLADFITDCCVLGPRCRVAKGELYSAYEAWCEKANEKPVSKREVTRHLEARGIGSGREGDARTRVYVGIGLRTDTDRCSVSPS